MEESTSHFGLVDQIPPMEPVRRTSAFRRGSFLEDFVKSKGAPQIILLCLLLAFSFGSIIGVVPAVMTDRYARLNHGYTDERPCSAYTAEQKPRACLAGSADAQKAVAIEQLISNTLTFFTSSLMGSLSDEYGRKDILLFGLLLSSFSPLCLVLVQMSPQMSPFWYYTAGAITGLVNTSAVALSALSDVMSPEWRAPSFGLLLAGFSLGFAFAPQFALLLGHWRVSILSLANVWTGLLLMIFFFPETVKPETAARARALRKELSQGLEGAQRLVWILGRPLRELSILNRNRLFRLLSMLAFFSGMVSSGNQTMLLYYIEERLDFNDKDIAIMFVLFGVSGIIVQAFVLKVLSEAIGERHVVIVSFVVGFVHNVLYGVATNKATIFLAMAMTALVGMAFPTISAIKANNVDESEQGRIQGALYSVQALAAASGPVVMRWIFGFTKDGAFMGPGTMYIIMSLFYLVAVYFAYLLPRAEANSRWSRCEPESSDMEASVETPLLS